ncbi:MAG: peptidase E [Myxococcales bacterium]|nr:MAG: peptidase E [Myxococcales bacterium]
MGKIVAMGGGGFSSEPENPLLDDFILSLSRRQPARVCFLPTASSDSPQYIARFYRALAQRCLAADLTLVDSATLPRRPASTEALAAFVAEQDIFYVGGGSTLHLLALWRAHGLDRLLRDAWQSGAILCGVSAGMNCWFEASNTDSFGPLALLKDGLGLVPGAACPHYDGEAQRRVTFRKSITDGMISAGFAADDGAAFVFEGTTLVECVSSRPQSHTYSVTLREGELVEEALPVRYLGA